MGLKELREQRPQQQKQRKAVPITARSEALGTWPLAISIRMSYRTCSVEDQQAFQAGTTPAITSIRYSPEAMPPVA